jgi:hypothetical protein
MSEDIINRVAKSGIVSIDLEDFFPKDEIIVFDIKDWLFHGLILKEADFRQKLEEHDWKQYEGKYIAVTCTTDAIIPSWAYMLLAAKLQPYAAKIVFGNAEQLLDRHYMDELSKLKFDDFFDKRVVVKGCGEKPVPTSAYVEITRLLLPYAKTIMYGEPCSTVPVFKKAKLKD